MSIDEGNIFISMFIKENILLASESKCDVEKMATGLQWTTTEIKPKPTHTQNQSKEFFVTKT